MEKDIVEKFMISKEDLEKHFNNKRIIEIDELKKYYEEKGIKTSRLFPDLV